MKAAPSGKKSDLQYPNPETAGQVRWNADAGDVKPPRPGLLARALAPLQGLFLTSALFSLIMGLGLLLFAVAVLWVVGIFVAGRHGWYYFLDLGPCQYIFWGIIVGVTLWGVKFWLSAILEERSSRRRMEERAARPSLKEQLIRPPEDY